MMRRTILDSGGRGPSRRSAWLLVTVLVALVALVLASGPAVAAPSSVRAPTIRFTLDTLGDKPNGFSSVANSVAHFFDSDGEDLSVVDVEETIGHGLVVFYDDSSRLIIRFDVPISRLSLVFGNDDLRSQEGDVAILRVLRGGVVVRSASVVMNRNNDPDQRITVGGTKFRWAEFFYARGETPIDLEEVVDNIRIAPVCKVKGTGGRDRLDGNARANSICGYGGNDRISARGGNDFAHGGSGDDRIRGGAGGDTLLGAKGDDYLNAADGVEGNDTVYGGGGYDTCVLDSGDAAIACEETYIAT